MSTEFAPLHRRGTERLARSHWGSGRAIWEADAGGRDWQAETEVTEETAPEQIAAALGIEPGAPGIVRRRLHRIGDRPVQLSASWLPASIAAGTPIAEEESGPGGVYARLLDLGYPPARFTEVVSARMPSPDETEALELPQGTPVILITRTALTDNGTVVEVNNMVLDATAHRVEYVIDA